MAEVVVGDIHGCSKTFRRLVEEELQLEKRDVLYCIGDYVDRGPDSKGVIDYILNLREQGYTVETLRGNHEQMWMDSQNSDSDFKMWFVNGGQSTIRSFGKDLENDIYRKFLEETKLYIQTEEYILVHAGLSFYNEDIFEDTYAMLWIRKFEVDEEKLGGKILIHGHTPTPLKIVQSRPFTNPINIDTGCVFTELSDMGYLSAINLTERRLISIKNIDVE